MPYVVGVVLSLSVALFASRVGLDRDRAFYPTVLIVIGLYYVLFAAMSESVHTVFLESMVMTGFSIAAVVGFKSRVRVTFAEDAEAAWASNDANEQLTAWGRAASALLSSSGRRRFAARLDWRAV